MQKSKLLLGSHMSIAGGIELSLYRGAALGCTCIQIFTHNNRQWGNRLFTPQECELFKKAKQETGITHIVVHASYLINLGSLSQDVVKKSINALEHELIRCDQLDIKYLVLHPGAGLTPSYKAIEQISASLNELFDKINTKATILLETMAGQGTSVGNTFEELAHIYKLTNHKHRIGICLDTCHLWAAGYDISTKKKYQEVLHQFNNLIGLQHIKAIHLNDSQKAFNSHVDRHANIGKGTIPLEAFACFLNDPLFFNIAKIIETPKKSAEDDPKNLAILKSLLTDTTKKLLHIKKDSNS